MEFLIETADPARLRLVLLVGFVGHCVGSTTLALERIACSSSTAALRRLSGSTFFRASAPENRLPASRLISPVILSLSALSVWMNSTSDASASIVITRPLGSLTFVISPVLSSNSRFVGFVGHYFALPSFDSPISARMSHRSRTPSPPAKSSNLARCSSVTSCADLLTTGQKFDNLPPDSNIEALEVGH